MIVCVTEQLVSWVCQVQVVGNSRLVKEFFQSDDDSFKLNFSLLVLEVHTYS